MADLTQNQKIELEQIAKEIKKLLLPFGAAHGLWDVVSNYEEKIKDRETMFDFNTGEEWIEHAKKILNKIKRAKEESE